MLKLTALATIAVLATTGATFAAQYAYVKTDANVKKQHHIVSMTINYVEAGDKVKVVDSWNNWVKIQIPGPDGWVKKSSLSYAPFPIDPWNGNGQVCFSGPQGYLCIGN